MEGIKNFWDIMPSSEVEPTANTFHPKAGGRMFSNAGKFCVKFHDVTFLTMSIQDTTCDALHIHNRTKNWIFKSSCYLCVCVCEMYIKFGINAIV